MIVVYSLFSYSSWCKVGGGGVSCNFIDDCFMIYFVMVDNSLFSVNGLLFCGV